MPVIISMVCNLVVHYRETRIKTVNYAVELEAQKRKILELEQAGLMARYNALKSQLDPHFLFNTLGALMSLIEEDQELAVDYVQELSNVYRYLLLMNDKKIISIREEVQFIKSYYYLVSKRLGSNINLSIMIFDEQLACRIPPLTLQVLVENALKHNIVPAEKPLHINIFVDEHKNLVVQNNCNPKRSVVSSTGTGLSNLENRYHLLTDKKIQIISDKKNFTVKIPLVTDMHNFRGN
jgi:two-component system, LytTR family, sensor kinase